MTFLTSAWYIAVRSDEVGEEPLHRRPLGMPVLLCRTGDAYDTGARRLLQQPIAQERAAS